MINPN